MIILNIIILIIIIIIIKYAIINIIFIEFVVIIIIANKTIKLCVFFHFELNIKIFQCYMHLQQDI